MNILITICARGGSKGVKNKNIRSVAGKPLIQYTIDQAKKWGKANKIVCSTDSEKIAEIAKENGIHVPFMRPEELSSDTAGKISVIRHALEKSEEIYNEKYDLIVDLDVTSPIRTIEDLNKSLEIFNNKKPDLVLSVVEARKNPYFNLLELSDEGFAKLSKESSDKILRRQDAPKAYDANASIYFYSREFLMNPENVAPLSSKKVAMHVMDDASSIDVDTEMDLKYIEFLIENGGVSFD